MYVIFFLFSKLVRLAIIEGIVLCIITEIQKTMSSVSKVKICFLYPFSYLSKIMKRIKRKPETFRGKDKFIFKELLHFHVDDFRKKNGYLPAAKLEHYFERIIRKIHPEYFHWSLLKTWERFRNTKTYQEDIEHISKVTEISANKLVYINRKASSTNESEVYTQEWIHPIIAVAFATWLHPLYGHVISEQTNVQYDECYEETYYDAIHNFLEEIKDTNRLIDYLHKGGGLLSHIHSM